MNRSGIVLVVLALLLAGCADAPADDLAEGAQTTEQGDGPRADAVALENEAGPIGTLQSIAENHTVDGGSVVYHAAHWAESLSGRMALVATVTTDNTTNCTLSVGVMGAPDETGFSAFSLAGRDGDWFDWREKRVQSENLVQNNGDPVADPEPASTEPVVDFWRTNIQNTKHVARAVMVPDAQAASDPGGLAGTFAVDAFCKVPFKLEIRATPEFALGNEDAGATGIRSAGPTLQYHEDGGFTVDIGNNGTAFAFHEGQASVGEFELRTPRDNGGFELNGGSDQWLVLDAGPGQYTASHDYKAAKLDGLFLRDYLIYGAFGHGEPIDVVPGALESMANDRDDAGPDLE